MSESIMLGDQHAGLDCGLRKGKSTKIHGTYNKHAKFYDKVHLAMITSTADDIPAYSNSTQVYYNHYKTVSTGLR